MRHFYSPLEDFEKRLLYGVKPYYGYAGADSTRRDMYSLLAIASAYADILPDSPVTAILKYTYRRALIEHPHWEDTRVELPTDEQVAEFLEDIARISSESIMHEKRVRVWWPEDWRRDGSLEGVVFIRPGQNSASSTEYPGKVKGDASGPAVSSTGNSAQKIPKQRSRPPDRATPPPETDQAPHLDRFDSLRVVHRTDDDTSLVLEGNINGESYFIKTSAGKGGALLRREVELMREILSFKKLKEHLPASFKTGSINEKDSKILRKQSPKSGIAPVGSVYYVTKKMPGVSLKEHIEKIRERSTKMSVGSSTGDRARSPGCAFRVFQDHEKIP